MINPEDLGLRGAYTALLSGESQQAAFSHPDYTVGFGLSPNHAQTALAGYTAGRDLGRVPSPCPEG
jgi:hypothetical protein